MPNVRGQKNSATAIRQAHSLIPTPPRNLAMPETKAIACDCVIRAARGHPAGSGAVKNDLTCVRKVASDRQVARLLLAVGYRSAI